MLNSIYLYSIHTHAHIPVREGAAASSALEAANDLTQPSLGPWGRTKVFFVFLSTKN